MSESEPEPPTAEAEEMFDDEEEDESFEDFAPLVAGNGRIASKPPTVTADEKTPAPAAGTSRALLVGCTKYDHLPPHSSLRGAGNDVSFMRNVLVDRYQFSPDQIHCLVEEKEPENRPLKAHIVRELQWLADESRAGDRVVILLSGHGSQLPNDDPDDPDDLEPDGLDEIFCPADITPATGPDQPLPQNVLTDDELRVALDAIREQGAFVWIVIDACHSGSAVRGTEITRQLPADVLVPPAALAAARSHQKSNPRGISRDEDGFDFGTEQGGLVAIYAAQPHEPTIEMELPTDSDDPQWRGLLTYTLLQVLSNTESPLTYRELVQRIHTEYIQSYGRLGPTPLIEGSEQNLEVLGQTQVPRHAPLVLEKTDSGPWLIPAGRLQGLAKGSVFAVFPRPGDAPSEEPLGYVAVRQTKLTSSAVEPVQYEGQAPNSELPAGGRCVPVEVQTGSLTLKVAFQKAEKGPDQSEEESSIPKLLDELEQDPIQRLQVCSMDESPDWIVREMENGAVHLLPAEGWSKVPTETHFGPAPVENRLAWLRERLGRISRVKTLLKLCDSSKRQGTSTFLGILGAQQPCEIRLELLSVPSDAEEAVSVDWTDRHWQLNDGELVALNIKNIGRDRIDFSVLFIDSKYGITPLFPEPGVIADNRIQSGQEFVVGPMQVEASTLGLEHLVVIATKAAGQPIDFAWLAQDSLETTAAKRGAGARHPLDEMFQQALYSRQNVRGMRMADAESTCMRAISWQTVRTTEAPPEADATVEAEHN